WLSPAAACAFAWFRSVCEVSAGRVAVALVRTVSRRLRRREVVPPQLEEVHAVDRAARLHGVTWAWLMLQKRRAKIKKARPSGPRGALQAHPRARTSLPTHFNHSTDRRYGR